MNSELGIRNSELGKCHPERNAVRRGVEGSIRLVGALVALVMTFLTACTDYQEEFDNNFAALEYGDIENPELSSGVDPGSSGGSTIASSASVSSGADPLSSGTVPASSGAEPLSSGTVPTSSGAEPLSSGTVPTQSSGEQPSSSAESSSSVESSSSSILPYTPPSGPNYDTLDYNGQKYRTVKIGDQEWMAENMNAKVDGSACYRDSSKYCDMYGRLYSWDAAMKVCPEGWRLPDTTDWTILFDAVGGKATAATHLKAMSGWTSDGNGDDKFGFSAFAAGGSDTGSAVKYAGKGIDAAFWTSEVKNSYDAWGVGMYWADSHPKIEVQTLASNRRSVRCMKDAKPLSSSSVKSSSSSAEPSSSYVPPSGISYGKMTDPSTSAFSYRTVEIGNRTWMAENMAKGGGTLCPGRIQENCATYGHLYVWVDTKNLCPEGWSLPSKGEWEELIKSVGGGSAKQAGMALKTTSGWEKNGNGTDKYGFSALPAGYWSNDGNEYFGLGGAAHFWSQTESGSDSAYGLKMENSVDSAWMSKYSVTGKNYYALSVRCILDENYFVDNRDGKTYRMVKIGDQTWMAQNLNYKGEGKDTIGYCYGKNSANCNTYGRLYPIEETIEKGSVCPGGWHVPSYDEWQTLFDAVGGKDSAAIHLKSKSDWKEDDYDDDVDSRGIDDYGFSALPGGRGAASGSFFDGEKQNAWFFSKTQCQITDCNGEYFTVNFVYSLPSAAFSDFPGTTSVSVRCLKDAE